MSINQLKNLSVLKETFVLDVTKVIQLEDSNGLNHKAIANPPVDTEEDLYLSYIGAKKKYAPRGYSYLFMMEASQPESMKRKKTSAASGPRPTSLNTELMSFFLRLL